MREELAALRVAQQKKDEAQRDKDEELSRLRVELEGLKSELSTTKTVLGSTQEKLRAEEERAAAIEKQSMAAELAASETRAASEQQGTEASEQEKKQAEQLRIALERIAAGEDAAKKLRGDSDAMGAELAAAQAQLATSQAQLSAERERASAREKEAAEELAMRMRELTRLAERDRGHNEEVNRVTAELERVREEYQNSKDASKAAAAKAREMEHQWIAESAKRKELHNKMMDMVGALRVGVRVRPVSKGEKKANAEMAVDVDREVIHVKHQTPSGQTTKSFDFTHTYGPDCDQDEIFKDTEPLMTSVLDGFNVCIFAYGQSGTGKTHTMEGNEEMPGLAPRAVARLFEVMQEREKTGYVKHECFMSMLELYNEQIRDLLGETSATPKKYEIHHDAAIGIYVKGLTSTAIDCASKARKLTLSGNANRAVGVTNLNEQSSRSHMIVSYICLTTNLRTGKRQVGKLSLVDLAGSERLAKAQTTGQALKETQAINKSLSALGNVLNCLARKEAHIPYRDSKLTYLLQDSLGGNSKTLMLVTCGPAKDNSAETINSLTFASRTKAVVLGKAVAREVGDKPSRPAPPPQQSAPARAAPVAPQ